MLFKLLKNCYILILHFELHMLGLFRINVSFSTLYLLLLSLYRRNSLCVYFIFVFIQSLQHTHTFTALPCVPWKAARGADVDTTTNRKQMWLSIRTQLVLKSAESGERDCDCDGSGDG